MCNKLLNMEDINRIKMVLFEKKQGSWGLLRQRSVNGVLTLRSQIWLVC